MAVCSRGRGRPQKPIPEVVARHWADTNQDACPKAGVHSQRQAWFKRDCAHGCETKIQIKTACKKLERAFACPWHGPHGKELSAQQLAVTNTISSIPGVGRVAVEQYCVLDIAQKPVDIVLRDHGLIIEVDGLQHEHHAAGFGEEAGQQFSRDREFDRKVLQSGRRLCQGPAGVGKPCACSHKEGAAATTAWVCLLLTLV